MDGSALGMALLFLACLGHFVLVLGSHNWWYGQGLHKHVVRAIQAVHALVFLAGPVVLWRLCGPDLLRFLREGGGGWHAALTAYLVLCWLAAGVVLPVVTIRRHWRGRPAALVSNHTETVDIARLLGCKPAGRGRFSLIARLPGNEVFRVDFTEKQLRVPRLPAAWDGLSVLHLSDLHLSGTPDLAFYEQVVERCRAWEPDLVALTGDIVDSHEHHRWVVRLLARLRWRVGAFAIFGNHDRWHDLDIIRRRVRRAGFQFLGDSWKRIEVRGEPMVVVGHQGPWLGPPPDLSACPAGPFRMLLSHTPDNIGWARRHGIDLMLAGHVHGGQVRLPVIGSVVVPSRYGRRYDCGTFHEPPTLLHVSRGLSGQEPLRYNCRPEVTKLILRPA